MPYKTSLRFIIALSSTWIWRLKPQSICTGTQTIVICFSYFLWLISAVNDYINTHFPYKIIKWLAWAWPDGLRIEWRLTPWDNTHTTGTNQQASGTTCAQCPQPRATSTRASPAHLRLHIQDRPSKLLNKDTPLLNKDLFVLVVIGFLIVCECVMVMIFFAVENLFN